jgi:hypothetical protein
LYGLAAGSPLFLQREVQSLPGWARPLAFG